MYKVYFYRYNKAGSKLFATLHEAIHFSVYKLGYGECGEIVKVTE